MPQNWKTGQIVTVHMKFDQLQMDSEMHNITIV